MVSVSELYNLILLATVVLAQTSNNEQCLINKEVVVQDADVRFAFMMSFRKNDQTTNSVNSYTCSILSREPMQNYLAAEWVVERLNKANNGTGYIPGVKIGFYGMDDCRSAVYSSRNALSFLDVWVPSTIRTCTGKLTEALHIGLIGPSRSSTATRVASLLRDVQVPIISMAATSAELSNMTDYPTFFRTVPSDEHQVNMIVQILEQLSWTYVAVVYSNDEYGITAAAMLSDIAAKKGICISKKFSFESENAILKADLLSLIRDAKGNSIAVPFIGTRDKAENFLSTIYRLARLDGSRDIRFGFRLILSESTNTDVTIYNMKDIGYGTMAIGASNVFLKDLYDDLTAKVERVKSRKENHTLIQQYFKDNGNDSPLISPDTLDTFVPQTLHAVFALIEALKMEHLAACGGQPGVCQALRSNVENGKMLDQVKKVFVDYKSMDVGIPPEEYRKNNYTVSFDKNGDINLVNMNPAYTLYQYRGQDSSYEQIGSYVGRQTILNMDKMKFYTPNGQPYPSTAGQPSSNIPTSMCNTDCSDCLNDNIIPIAFFEGDVYIVGIFSIHGPNKDNPFACGQFRSIGNDVIAAEAFLYAIRDLRNKTNIKFGAIAIDDCYSFLRSTSILSDHFSGLLESGIKIFTQHISKDKVVGVVGCRSSGCTIPTAQFFTPLKVPVVSYAASSPDLDDKINFPYFLRTIPSDVYQAQVILQVIKAMNWEYVGLLYVKNNYGTKAMKELKNQAMQAGSGVCIAPEFGISEAETESDSTEFRQICVDLLNQEVKVVVFFGIDERYRNFLSFMEREKRYGKFIFIGSEDWGVNVNIYNSGQKSARGSLILKIQDIQLESELQFRQHLASKLPSANDSNIWFTEFWQNVFNCNIKGGFINTFSGDCGPTLKLSDVQLDARAGEQRVKQVMNSAYALGMGLKEAKQAMCEGEFPCPHFRQNTEKAISYILKQTRQQGNLKYNIFDNTGNGALGYDIFNVQQDTIDGNPYVKVGTFNSKENTNWNVLQKNSLKFYSETGNVMTDISAKCTQTLCQHCPNMYPTSETKKSSSSVPEYRQSDILLISLVIVLILAVLVAIAAFIVCFTKKYKGLKKTLQGSREKIYEEPDKEVYQQYAETHGIVFANMMNPYPIMNSIGLNNGGSSASDTNGGVNNPAFINDIDSVSQIVAMRNQKQSNPQIQSRNATNSLTSSSHFVSPYSSRPLPVSPIGSDAQGKSAHDNLGYVETGSEKNRGNNYLAMSTPGEHANQNRVSDMQSLESGPVCMAMSSSLRGNDAKGPDQEGFVYFMQGPNGQLAPHIIYSPTETGVVVQQRQPSLEKQASIRSHNGSASSALNPSYGPYSTAAYQRLKLHQQQPQFMQGANISGRPVTPVYKNPSTMSDIVSNNNDISSGGPLLQHGNKMITGSEVDYSPIHYASPTKDTAYPAHHVTPTSHYQSPPSQSTHLSGIAPGSLPSHPGRFAEVPHDYPEDNQESSIEHQQEQPELSFDRSLSQHSQYSMMSSPIPDVVGQSDLAQEYQRQVSLESVNLSSSKESLNDIEPDVRGQGNSSNGKMILSTLSPLSGNISRV